MDRGVYDCGDMRSGTDRPWHVRVRAWLCIVALVGALGVPGPEAAADPLGLDLELRPEPVEITADKLLFDAPRQLYEASGSVWVRQGERVIQANWLAFDAETGRGVASGDVRLVDGVDTLKSDYLDFDFETEQGIVFDATLNSESSGFEMRGAEIEKTGRQTYRFRQVIFTTCDCPDEEAQEPWQIAAKTADLEIGGYATARDAAIEVLGVPVLWSPWMGVPVKTERQSGVLLPDFGISRRNGVDLGLPLFWAVGDPLNLTLTPRWLEDRGAKGDLEAEYVLGERSWGRLFGAFLHDEGIDPDSRATPFGRDRWSLLGQQDFDLPGRVRFKADFAFVSDNQYPLDFDELRRYRTHRFIESTAFAGRSFGPMGRFAALSSLRWVDDLQNPTDRDRDDFLLQRPGLAFAALPAQFGPVRQLTAAFDVDYAYYTQRSRDFPVCCGTNPSGSPVTRADGVFVDSGIDGLPNGRERIDGNFSDFHRDDFALTQGPEGNGRFEEGELLADRGHVVQLWPRVGVPVRLADRIDVYSQIGWRETLYDSEVRGFARRGMFTALVDAHSTFQRRFGDSVVHILEPRVGYALVTAPDQRDNPLFVPATAVPQRRMRQLELFNVVADRADRVERFNAVSYGFSNRFYRTGRPGQAPRLLADISISNLYSFESRRFEAIYLDGRAAPLRGLTGDFSVGFDPNAVRLSEVQAGIRYAWSGHSLAADYRYLRDIPAFFEDFSAQNERFENFADLQRVSQFGGQAHVALGSGWSATYRIIYSFDQDLVIAQRGGLDYFSRCGCWGIGLALGQNRSRGLSFNVVYRIVGFGNDLGGSQLSLDSLGFSDGL